MLVEMEKVNRILEVLTKSDKSYTGNVARDPITAAQTAIFFRLGMDRNADLMAQGTELYAKTMADFKGGMVDIISDYINKKLPESEIISRWNALTKDSYEKLFLSGALSVGNPYYRDEGLTKHDINFLNKARAEEAGYFKNFLADINDPNHTPGRYQYLDRAALYSDSGKAIFSGGMVAGAGDDVEVHWVLGPREIHCADCVALSSKVWTWQTLPTTPGACETECFVDARTGILTDRGVRRISRIKAGNRVMTHRGTFETVLAIRQKPLKDREEIVDVVVDVDGRLVKYTVVPTHSFQMSDGSWKEAGAVAAGDLLKMIIQECSVCGKKFTINKNTECCSIQCSNKKYGKTKTERAHEAVRARVAEGTWTGWRHFKGKTYEEIYGDEAENQRSRRQETIKNSCAKYVGMSLEERFGTEVSEHQRIAAKAVGIGKRGKTYKELAKDEATVAHWKATVSADKKGKTLAEIWGEEKASVYLDFVRNKSFDERFGLEKSAIVRKKLRDNSAMRKLKEAGHADYDSRYGTERADLIRDKIRQKTIQLIQSGGFGGGGGVNRNTLELATREILIYFGIAFTEQEFLLNRYLVDFYIPEYKIVIEADGDYWHANPKKYSPDTIIYQGLTAQQIWDADVKRDADLRVHGYTVLRFWECEVYDETEMVLDTIQRTLANHEGRYLVTGAAKVVSVCARRAPKSTTQKRYDLMVENSESYVTSWGIVSHNCNIGCGCRLEIQPKPGTAASDAIAPGSASQSAMNMPGRWSVVTDADGNAIGGATAGEADDYYQALYKARQMIELADDAAEKMDWIHIRQDINRALINWADENGYVVKPTISVTTLIQAAKDAEEVGGAVYNDAFATLPTGSEVLLLRGDVYSKGIIQQTARGTVFNNGKTQLDVNDSTDVVFTLEDVEPLKNDPRGNAAFWKNHIFDGDDNLYKRYLQFYDDAETAGATLPNEQAWIEFRRHYIEGRDGRWVQKLSNEQLVEIGTASSGNYGHAGGVGGPGNPGGSTTGGGSRESSGAGSIKVFHGTNAKVLKNILIQGIAPTGSSHWGKDYYTGDRKNSVFITKDFREASRWAADSCIGRHFKATAVIVEARVPKSVQFKKDLETGEHTSDFYTHTTIKPEWIKNVYVHSGFAKDLSFTYKKLNTKKFVRLHIKESDGESDIFYIPILLLKSGKSVKEILSEIGTASSGNRGHTGRPGEVGGSGPGGGVDGAGSLSEVIVKHISDFRETYGGSGNEHSITIGKDGEIISTRHGSENGIVIPASEVATSRNAAADIHNHPNGSSFSGKDLYYYVHCNIQRGIIACNRVVYEVSPGADGWPIEDEKILMHECGRINSRLSHHYQSEYNDNISKGMSVREAVRKSLTAQTHEAMLRLSKKYGFNYSMVLR